MKLHQERIGVRGGGRGLHEITSAVNQVVGRADVRTGMCQVFVQHTSASLLIQENADPSARSDLERWFDRLVPEHDPLYQHTAEGPDDMPAHLKAALTSTSEMIPISDRRLALGTWQGLYLFEHRRRGTDRVLVVTIWGT
ncbi:MAG: YjbQ family protein [Candidatus Eisenbacteria bacterium]|nr:YjbQ family protein [Candidatus Eisenbacteria bacterium]